MEVLLGMECHLEGGFLHVKYVVHNQGKLPVLSYDGAPGVPPDAEWPDLKGQLYITVGGDVVALKRIIPPPPPGMQVNRVFIPPLGQTMPGERREVRFKLAEPLTERSQYTPDFPGAQYRERTVHQVQLDLGCFWKTDAMNLIPFPANPKAFTLRSAHGPASIVVANAAQFVNVRERTDSAFFRA